MSSMDDSKTLKAASKEWVEQRWHRPFFTVSTFVICLIVLIFELYENGVHAGAQTTAECSYGYSVAGARFCIASFSVNPLLGPSPEVMLKMGARLSYLIVDHQEYWRLITPIYLHAGIIHFMINMIALLHIGVRLEWVHGCFRVGFVYLLSGVFGVVMGAIFSGNTVGVGASGAIFGLIGASIGDLIQNWKLHKSPCSNFTSLVVISALQLLLGTIPMLDNFAHFFGFLIGLTSSLCVLILQRVSSSGSRLDTKCHQRILQVLAASALPCVFVGAVVVLFAGSGNDLCPHCQHISCIPFPWGCDESVPTGTGTCWWDCTAAYDPRCSATFTHLGNTQNGTVVVHCPLRNTIQNVTRHPVDVSSFDQHGVRTFCRDFCPEM